MLKSPGQPWWASHRTGALRHASLFEDADEDHRGGEHADVLFRNAWIYTVDPKGPSATAVAIRDEELEVGDGTEGSGRCPHGMAANERMKWLDKYLGMRP